jgi:hypothetical protein
MNSPLAKKGVVVTSYLQKNNFFFGSPLLIIIEIKEEMNSPLAIPMIIGRGGLRTTLIQVYIEISAQNIESLSKESIEIIQNYFSN